MAARESTRRFHFLKEIASGGFGSVYLAKVMHADGFSRLAAIKLLHQRWSENAEIAQRMRDEARLLGWLRHRNIVDVIDLTTIGGRVAVIMEYLEAVDLKCAVNTVADRGEKMPPRAALEMTAFVASALDAAYNRPPYEGDKPLRVIHRDIKPSNIMVDESGTVKVLDFGVARADFDHRESHTQELQFGSVDYMPPERLFFEPETPYSDVYSLGATIYELLALDKLGKAKGRPDKHAAFLEERLQHLRSVAALDGLSGDATIDLIREMCAYNHEGRPGAADVVTRCRALSRGFEGEGLPEWAERLIPPLVKAAREAPREPNPLTDSILTEDSASFKADDTFVDSLEEGGGVVLRPGDPVPQKIPPRDDTRLKKAAQAEMARPVEDTQMVVIDEMADSAETTVRGPPPPTPASRTWDDVGKAEDPTQLGGVEVGSLHAPPPPPPQDGSGVRARPVDAGRNGSASFETPKKGKSLLVVGVVVVGLLGLLGVGGLVAAGMFLSSGDAPPVAASPATSAAASAGPAAPTVVGGLRFVSAAPSTAKISVTCDGKEVTGANETAVDAKKADSCSVKVMLKDRTRLFAEVAAPTEGTYTCFVGGDKACSRSQ